MIPMFHPHPNLMLLAAALLTIGLGVFFCMPLPLGPDRAMLGFTCFFIQIPRWIFLAGLLALCVSRGAFTWPTERWAQYFVVFTAHFLLGVAAICAALGGLGVTSGVPGVLSRAMALSTVLIPAMQIAFIGWFLHPNWHRNLDPAAVRHIVNVSLAVFGATVALFGTAWLISNADTARTRNERQAQEQAKEDAKVDKESRQFAALRPDSPLEEWMKFLDYPHSEARRKATRQAILARANLGRDLAEVIVSPDAELSAKAMHFVGELTPPPSEVAEAVRRQARLIVELAEMVDPANPASRNILYERVFGLADGVTSAARGLWRLGVDIRPELRAIAAACGPREQVPPHDIQAGCELVIKYLTETPDLFVKTQ
jgi:hypothetical protein